MRRLVLEVPIANPVYLDPIAYESINSPLWARPLTALIIGLITAFAFQLLLTILSVAIALSSWRIFTPRSDTADLNSKPNLKQDEDTNIRTIAGLGILLTVNAVLFAASFIGTKFSQIDDLTSGAIIGVVIWAAYFLILIWLSSVAVNSIVGSLLNLTTAGFRRIVSTVTAIFRNDEYQEINQLKSALSPQLVDVVQQKLQAEIDTLMQPVIQELEVLRANSIDATQSEAAAKNEAPESDQLLDNTIVDDTVDSTEFEQKLSTYLATTSAKNLTPKQIERKLQKLLQGKPAPAIDISALTTALQRRQELTDKKKRRILVQVEATWQRLTSAAATASKVDAEAAQASALPLRDDLIGQLSQAAVNVAKEQVVARLPDFVQHPETVIPELMLAPTVLANAHATAKDSIDAINATLPTDEIKQYFDELVTTSQANLTDLSQTLSTQVESLRQQTIEQVQLVQNSAEEQIEDLKQQAQKRVEATRKAAAVAAWWLFVIASTGAVSAGLAGAIASGFNPIQSLSL